MDQFIITDYAQVDVYTLPFTLKYKQKLFSLLSVYFTKQHQIKENKKMQMTAMIVLFTVLLPES